MDGWMDFVTIAVILLYNTECLNRIFCMCIKNRFDWMDGWIYMVEWIDRQHMNVACKSQKIFHSTKVTILIS